MSTPSLEEPSELFFLVLAEGRVVAAARHWADGFYWCQSWPADDLAATAEAAVDRWPLRPILNTVLLGELDRLRIVQAMSDNRGAVLVEFPPDEITSHRDPERFVRDLVASGLSKRTKLATVSWPSSRVATYVGDPDPEMAARVEARVAAEHAARAARRQRADAEFAVARAEAAAAAARDAEAKAAAEGHAAEQQAARILTEDEFVAAVVDGATQPNADLYRWADDLLDAVQEASASASTHARGYGDLTAIGDLLRQLIAVRRADLNPFTNYLEAPEAIHRLYGAHGAALQALTEQRDQALEPVLRETASALFSTTGTTLTWGDLIEHGASPDRPEVGSFDWEDY